MATQRSYTFSMVTYARRCEIQPLLDKAKHWAYIYHENDVNTAGPHYHILVTFQQQKSFALVRSYVDSEQNTFAEEIKSTIGDVLNYWTHNGIAEKTQHDRTEIVYDDANYWKRYDEEIADEANEAFLNDLLGKTSRKEMARRYGRDYMKNYQKYESFRCAVKYDEMRELQKDLAGTPASDETFHEELSVNELALLTLIRTYEVDVQALIDKVEFSLGLYDKAIKEIDNER